MICPPPVIWIVMSNARMRSVTNYFIVNLSIADIMNATLNVIPNFTYMLTGNWPFGKLWRKTYLPKELKSPITLMKGK